MTTTAENTSTANPTTKIAQGSALWPAQARASQVYGRQLVISKAEGSYIETEDGRRLFDGTAGLWHANIGHSRPELAQAAYDQMMNLETYHTFARFTNDQAAQLAEKLAEISPIPDPKIILNSGGSDAIDVACKLARRHWQREGRHEKQIILSREFAYHGLHAYGTSIAGLEFNREGYGTDSLVPETSRVSFNDPEQVRRAVAEIGPENIAAIVTEPVQGTGGVNPPSEGYLETIQELCREHEILLILDEVITGFGRVGTMFAAERYGLQPDLVTFAKGVTSGYAPLGGIFVSRRVWEPFFEDSDDAPIFRHGSTYAGHATASAVAIKHLDILREEHLVDRVRELEPIFAADLEELAQQHDDVAEVRHAGLLGGVTLREGVAAEKVCDRMIDKGFISRPLRGNTLQVSPPFIVTEQELKDYFAAMSEAITEEATS
ncbi:aminotransferase family protein [Kocuria sp. HSID16901]|uniref:aminotransferase family protein n=1 Tax=Kocuria sp. HSID16901 TaxID=2419505 RepID=UPI0009E4FBD2|nr:aminotransferase class III-fold pyridoxal phosphate-dependent enzyme [Kocuria sp. HSID16901]MCT1366878.1 aminotransferase class III-fold pyridoxal phosphate-dependent enzyme [Rothia sp. p3-SID1597]RUQ20700.1 aspartate aminotransferase family protein [Kocuria sp. HSID16901]